MSMFSKPTSEISPEDLQELLSDQAVENIRLEFKRDYPDKDELLKKLSSFANTFGGYLIIGAEADSRDGRLVAVPGVIRQSGYKQRVIQWCFDGAGPPLSPQVSDPIQLSGEPDSVCYVIFIDESDLSPHFLNGRKGVYIRTDEFSQRFEPRLATYDELMQLNNRRGRIERRRVDLIDRALSRFKTFADTRYSDLGNNPKGLGSYFSLAIVPRYPARRICSESSLLNVVKSERVNWRQVGFPRETGGVVSQHESAIILRPGSSFSIFEANIWGLLFYSTEIERVKEQYQGIHLNHFLGQLLVFLEHGRRILGRIGYAGSLVIEFSLDRIRGVPWVYVEDNLPCTGPASVLDDSVSFFIQSTSELFMQKRNAVALDLLTYVFFAMNWPDIASTRDQLANLLRKGYKYNFWEEP